MMQLASRRVRYVLPDKRIICALIILAMSLLDCGSDTSHGNANKYPTMHSKTGLNVIAYH